jgi:hypothetical protein
MPRDSKYNQGRFHPQNPEKYKGDVRNIIYRSSWELKFMQWCDRNPSVIEYASEEFCIPYLSPLDSRVHRYFPDFLIKIKEQSGEIKKYVIEIKPKRQTVPPIQTPKKRNKTFINEAKTYAVNEAKWRAAEQFCKDRMIGFMIITEDHLNIK